MNTPSQQMPSLRNSVLKICLCLPWMLFLQAQSTSRQLKPLLERETLEPGLLHHLLGEYLLARSPQLPPLPSRAEEWTAQASDTRRKLLREVVYRGWPQEWVEAPLRFREVGPPQEHRGYRLRKLLLQVLPGLQIPALLYEPTGDRSPLPAVLNVNGHVRGPGKSVEYKQKRCISLARRGVVALNLEWLACGELSHPENQHWFGAHLDLVGANAIGLFYLAMRKGLDYLEQHPRADPKRLAVTGLSGGGWQTIILSSLDERVAVAVPVAGYSALISRIERPQDTGDIEQNATDLLRGQDYSTLTAIRAPKPTLLIYNAEDECCFRAPLVRPYIYDDVKPFFGLFGKGDHLGWHENTDPSTHNYQLDNRLQAYGHLSRHFGLGDWDREDPVDREIQSYEDLVVGLPEDNLTILGVARQLADRKLREADPEEGRAVEDVEDRRARLRSLVRFQPVAVKHGWALHNTKNRGVESYSYRIHFSDGLVASALWGKGIATGDGAPASILLLDEGKAKAGQRASDRINRGEQVLVADLILTGEAQPRRRNASDSHRYAQLLATVGDRPLGIRASHLLALAGWLKDDHAATEVRVEAQGFRSQVVALLSAALDPAAFSEVRVEKGMKSLRHLLAKPVRYSEAPELFCLGLFPEFDLKRLISLAKPVPVEQRFDSSDSGD